MKLRPTLLGLGAAMPLVCVLIAASVHAAPATSEELNGTADEAQATAPTQGRANAPAPLLPAGTGVQQSTTVELLLQLQDRPNLLGAEGSKTGAETRRSTAAQGTGSSRREAAPTSEEANPLVNLKEMVLGPAKPQTVDSDSREFGEHSGKSQRSQSDSGQPQRATSRSGDSEPRESLLSHPVVRFIRENRGLTITASIAVLVGIWLTANFSMRRSR